MTSALLLAMLLAGQKAGSNDPSGFFLGNTGGWEDLAKVSALDVANYSGSTAIAFQKHWIQGLRGKGIPINNPAIGPAPAPPGYLISFAPPFVDARFTDWGDGNYEGCVMVEAHLPLDHRFAKSGADVRGPLTQVICERFIRTKDRRKWERAKSKFFRELVADWKKGHKQRNLH